MGVVLCAVGGKKRRVRIVFRHLDRPSTRPATNIENADPFLKLGFKRCIEVAVHELTMKEVDKLCLREANIEVVSKASGTNRLPNYVVLVIESTHVFRIRGEQIFCISGGKPAVVYCAKPFGNAVRIGFIGVIRAL